MLGIEKLMHVKGVCPGTFDCNQHVMRSSIGSNVRTEHLSTAFYCYPGVVWEFRGLYYRGLIDVIIGMPFDISLNIQCGWFRHPASAHSPLLRGVGQRLVIERSMNVKGVCQEPLIVITI